MPDLETLIKKEYGDSILITANSIVDRKRDVVPVSPTIDLITNGGLTTGLHVFAGKSKSGKTSCCLYFAASAQKKGYTIYYFNVENRLKKRDLECVPGLDLNNFYIIESSEDKILSATDYLQIAHQIISTKKKIVIIFDSMSAISSESELVEDMSKQLMDNGNKAIAKFVRKSSAAININDVIFISIHHMGVNMTSYGAPYIEKTSTAIRYQADTKLIFKSSSYWKIPKNSDNIIGQEIQIFCEHSALGPPGKTGTGFLVYGKSISKEAELINIAKDINLIDSAGAWYTMNFLEEKPKFQGEENCRLFLVENPQHYDTLNQLVRERLGLPTF